MGSEAVQFGASLLAVLALVMLTWLLGFREEARLSSEDEARELMRLAPGGFEPVAIGLDCAGRSAIGRDAAGRLLALAPHGGRFVAHPVSSGADLTHDGDTLHLALGNRRVSIDLGEAAADWISADSAVS